MSAPKADPTTIAACASEGIQAVNEAILALQDIIYVDGEARGLTLKGDELHALAAKLRHARFALDATKEELAPLLTQEERARLGWEPRAEVQP